MQSHQTAVESAFKKIMMRRTVDFSENTNVLCKLSRDASDACRQKTDSDAAHTENSFARFFNVVG
jgi:hypothetical protein